MDQVVGRLLQAFLRHQLLLVELFSRTQAGIHDLNVLVRAIAGQPDQVPRQHIDLHRLTHIQDEYLAAFGVAARLQHKAHRLRNGHKIADDIRMRHGNGAALSDLLLEQRNH